MMKVELLRQLDGKNAGDTAEYPKLDAIRLEDMGIVKILGEAEAAAPEAKAEPAPQNKAAKAPANKGRSAKKVG